MPRVIAALLFLTAALRAQPKLEFEHYQLPNGMQVILHLDRKAPLVHLNLRYRVGSKHEAPGRSGFAHLFEHMMFEGRDTSTGYAALAEEIGATGVSGYTYVDYTEYSETVPAGRLERMLWLESNRIARLPQNLTRERFEKEREIVLNERREKIENQPYAIANALVHQQVFPPGHPYAHDLIGSPADLMAASLDEVRAFYRDYYTSDNLSMVVAGDFDPAQAKQWIARYFGSMTPGSGLAGPARSVPPLAAPKLVDVTAHVPDPKFVFAWPAPGAGDAEAAALEMAEFILTDGWNHLNSALKEHVCSDAGDSYYELQDASAFTVSVTPNPGVSLAQVEEVLAAEIARFAHDGPTAQELERARNNLESRQLSSLEDLSGVASTLNQVQQVYGGVEHFNDWATRHSKVTADAVRKAVSRWLATPNRLAIRFTPMTARRDETPEPDRNMPPPFQPEKPFHPPEVKSAKLPNGLQIFVVERHELPKVAVMLRFNLGSAHSPPGKPGVAVMTMATADCGTAGRTVGEIEKEKSRLAMSVHGDADTASQDAWFEVLRKNFDPAFHLFADQLLHPVYPQAIFEEHRNDIVAEMEKSEGRIDDYARFVMSIAFGPRHPLGATATPESLRSITIDDVVAFRKRYWHPDAAVLVFAGDITLQEAVAAAARYLGEWDGSAGQAQPLPPPAPMPGRTFLMDRRGATQTTVVMVQPGIPRDHPDYPALLLAATVWGGGDFSRLFHNVRMDRAITYWAGSELWPLPGNGLWIARSQVQVDKTREALAAFTRELRDLAGARPITQQELEAARQSLIRGYPGQFEQASPVADYISRIWAFGLPVSELETWPQRIASVTLQEVNAVARKYARPDKAVFLLIGDREKIGPIDGAVAIQ